MAKVISDQTKNNFNFLMDCIAEKTEQGADPKNGLLYFVKDSLIAERVATKYASTSLEYFKAFFCNVVLEMHSSSELNFREFEKYFQGCNNEKKYDIDTEKLDRYFDKQENLRYIQENMPGTKSCENWEDVFQILLIERLQQVSHQCLKEYFLADKEKLEQKKTLQYTIDNKRTRDIEEIKRRLLRRVACAACLYEIFVCKFLEDDSPEEVFSALKVIKGSVEQFVSPVEEFKTQMEELKNTENTEESESILGALQELTEKLTVALNEIPARMDQAMYSITKTYYYFLHIRYVMALCAVISIIEYVNMNRDENAIPKRLKNFEAVDRMQKVIFNGECDFLLFDEDTQIRFNKNHPEVYKKIVEVIEEEKLIQELSSKDKEVQKEAMTLLQYYFIGILTDASEEDTDFLTAVNLIFRKCLK